MPQGCDQANAALQNLTDEFQALDEANDEGPAH